MYVHTFRMICAYLYMYVCVHSSVSTIRDVGADLALENVSASKNKSSVGRRSIQLSTSEYGGGCNVRAKIAVISTRWCPMTAMPT